ncbi:hypothetical protein C3L23_06215 [Nautilia sp. PV-1]|uniref:hypothetical protein n=1 Tax=Nautilia sp. PV-1 TaxID=2579250 RepID=UPI000FDCDA2A|nr:hypothetical protein [Nautilia sp. PV-1]AZV46881.1 hypothetical protein C3L23_06215 [Nautilia sp. PV-1]
MIIKEKLNDIVKTLLEAAKNCKTIPYPAIYEIFEDTNASRADIWNTFEAAGRKIAPLNKCIFGALLKDKEGLPKSGFFDTYKNHRSNEYITIVGNKRILELSEQEKEEIVENERQRIWNIFCINILPVKIFNGSDNYEDIENEILHRGLAIVIGGRNEVRNKINEIEESVNKKFGLENSEEQSITSFTYNHPDTELGILFDESIYNYQEAEKTAIEIYEKTNQGN